ncbi:hypothetical protein MFLAVUS_011270 [Mucor flavus]|uniref:Transposase IS204/IS1001/IS1096/IS1165 DDE domain-containing protein n=1 Tax=Mucor flavus TaxID=439312 RepID=A0ABP9ZF93_9FUNG
MPEAIIIDATYSTNVHKLAFVDIVGTSNITSTYSPDDLQTFAIAGHFRSLFLGGSKAAIDLLLAETNRLFQNIVQTRTEEQMNRAFAEFEAYVLDIKNFESIKDLEKAKKNIFSNMKKEHWVGYYANKLRHFGNRTSNRAEDAHSEIKTALGKISTGKISSVTDNLDAWYRKKIDERSARTEIEILGMSASLYDKALEYKFVELRNKVVRFAMDRISRNKSTKKNTKKKLVIMKVK